MLSFSRALSAASRTAAAAAPSGRFAAPALRRSIASNGFAFAAPALGAGHGAAPASPHRRSSTVAPPAFASFARRFMDSKAIQYTITDEAPQLATYAFLPVVRRFAAPYGIGVEAPDISLAGRILSHFPERLTEEQRVPDYLAQLGELTQHPHANIVKLPNISASIPQLNEAIAELQSLGYDVPPYPSAPATDEEREVARRYAKALGSAVNPVLREGNSDRRVAAPVKRYAQNNRPPVRMRDWPADSKTHVASMPSNDFFGSEQSTCFPKAGSVRIELEAASGTTTLKEGLKLQENEVIDASVMSASALREFFEQQLQEAKRDGLMVSLHLKATMMKISDPIIFGHAVSVYFKNVFEKYGGKLRELKVNPNHGVAAMLAKIATVEDAALRAEMEAEVAAAYEARPGLAMVDSSKGITNLHVPNDVIIDASMPPLVRDGGRMWNKDDALEDTKAIIPDRSYAGMYQAVVEDCKKHGQFDHSTMGSVANVGLMAQKAEEYGSHDKTFEMAEAGNVRVVDEATGEAVFEHAVGRGDIWRMCQTKDAPIQDWVKLAVTRARNSGEPAIFWLSPERAHDRVLIEKVRQYLPQHDTSGLDISIKTPVEAMAVSCERARAGQNTISVTGNVLRDYLTDLFPILELGTSAKMLSIVPLLAGGGLFETGAGGSAPKHVQQFLKEGHLRWDSLGEYLALAESLQHYASVHRCEKAKMLASTLNAAVGSVLDNNKSPSRKVKELDNRGSTFYVALYWAQAMAREDASFEGLASALAENEAKIVADLNDQSQGHAVDVGGYYKPDDAKATKEMLNADLARLLSSH
eukprot:TRINITY_DN119_c0_g1_i6.p1 TRINITY_DN119_c0_g1~~TRINITY_DN119_c0_g1_i6.p1  ORF type:complete len:824 (+),score=365.29 TRINITY_DN119_c0_g1_i6:35-2473(+)